MTSKKYVYSYSEGGRQSVDLLGGKGAGLAEMSNIGLNVPPGITITTEACRDYLKNSKFPDGMMDQTLSGLKSIERTTGKKFGDRKNPLLVSVRSGAPVSMPGMMDTILNVGLNRETVEGIASLTGNRRFALDSYRRLLQMFGSVVLGIPKDRFEEKLEEIKSSNGFRSDLDLGVEHLSRLIEAYHRVYSDSGFSFPEDPHDQLTMAIEAVFRSWNSDRAKAYREINRIPDHMGTAVNIVSMIFGNMGNDSATGVAFTRDANTGEKRLFAEYLPNAQGEDVVAGIRTPKHIESLRTEIPDAYEDLVKSAEILENHYKDMMDIEFTIEKGKFYLLQVRKGKRSARASIRIAVDLAKEGKISRKEAVMMVTPETLRATLYPIVKLTGNEKIVAEGLAASPGAASGRLCFSSQRAIELSKKEKAIILIRPETTADDVRGMSVSVGFLTQKGGMTSHAAVVARAMGKPAVVGAEEIRVDVNAGTVSMRGEVLHEGDTVTVDGTTGRVYRGSIPTEEASMQGEGEVLLSWADSFRKLGIRANANTPAEAILARKNGAEGIGLARTERMFLGDERIRIMRSMIMSESTEERKRYLNQLLPMQVSDFTEFFSTMEGFPVIIRLLDPPLHEFLPDKEETLRKLFNLQKNPGDGRELKETERLLSVIRSLEEFNPMLGFRGCRLGILYPEIYEMQVRAIISAAKAVKRTGKSILPEIMIPLVGHENELKLLRERLEKVIHDEMGSDPVEYKFGTMIEIPRACVTADSIARHSDFFSFGTNDLTQMTFGYSRDDAEGKFLAKYVELGILKMDPFETVDETGVGELMRMAVRKGKKSNPGIEIGICGEQGGDPETITFCHSIGLDYVSSSPYRIPVAKLAAARAAISSRKRGQTAG
ncbi:MAG: pyruvate, phosphate dikinase [Candidatus Thermoplasmatota archaeon]|nr:pyruvate, phosphate dikinase [Candidatus Thermoplasmatota archaeon]MCL5800401.1 pyruvate, phosphate dikinase [Candidatus Thermoplasmatota archaeon]